MTQHPMSQRELRSEEQAQLATSADEVARLKIRYLQLEYPDHHGNSKAERAFRDYIQAQADFYSRWWGYEWIEHCQAALRAEITQLEKDL